MVPCLHQRNIYIQKKLQVWKEQKCIPQSDAETPLTCAVRQTTPFYGRWYRAKYGNLRKLGWTYHHGTVLHQENVYIKRELRVWREQKCILLVGAETSLICAVWKTSPSHVGRYRADDGNLHKLGWTYHHGTVFAPRHSFYQKEATGMESPEMYSTGLCKNPIYLWGPTNHPVSLGAV